MTHSLYRIGNNAWGEDWVVVARAARGVNDAGATARLKRFLELARSSGAVNWGHGRGGGRLNSDWTTMIAHLADLATVTVVFDTVGYLEGFLDQLHTMDLRLSITVSGDMGRIKEICARRGWKPHSGRQAVGVFGSQECFSSYEALCIKAQCGHGLIAARLVEEMVDPVFVAGFTVQRRPPSEWVNRAFVAYSIPPARPYCSVIWPAHPPAPLKIRTADQDSRDIPYA